MKSILDPSFRYTASFNTDLQKTFAKNPARPSDGRGKSHAGKRGGALKVSSIVRKTATGQ
jgi:hypothetical protein